MPNDPFALIQQAALVLSGVAHVTPVETNESLDALSGARVFLKGEHLQRAGAFKFRGAYHAVSHWVARSPCRTFATVSSGNHAQALALACQLLGCRAHALMPAGSSEVKRRAVLAYGATVQETADRATANELLGRLAQELPAIVVHPFNDPLVIAGQATVLVEFLDQIRDLDIVLAPVGGGGLLSGICWAAATLCPQLEIFACEPAGALDAKTSVEENRLYPMTNPATIADGLRSSLGDLTLPILRRYLSGFFVVEEEEILQAMHLAHHRLGLRIEPSSAVALAPLLRRERRLLGKRVGVVLTGGNVEWSYSRDSLEVGRKHKIGGG